MLRGKGFTLYRVAALARARYPRQTPFHIRRNFYFKLRSGLSPTFQQVLALSELTGFWLWDWLAVFGFSPGDIPRIQAVLPRPRTGLIDIDLVDPRGLLPFLRYRRPGATLPSAAPLSQLLERSGSYRAVSLVAPARGDFVYAKIGTEDALAFPELVPGSIVRANPRLVGSSLLDSCRNDPDRLTDSPQRWFASAAPFPLFARGPAPTARLTGCSRIRAESSTKTYFARPSTTSSRGTKCRLSPCCA
jgi:hypothetical protein